MALKGLRMFLYVAGVTFTETPTKGGKGAPVHATTCTLAILNKPYLKYRNMPHSTPTHWTKAAELCFLLPFVVDQPMSFPEDSQAPKR